MLIRPGILENRKGEFPRQYAAYIPPEIFKGSISRPRKIPKGSKVRPGNRANARPAGSASPPAKSKKTRPDQWMQARHTRQRVDTPGTVYKQMFETPRKISPGAQEDRQQAPGAAPGPRERPRSHDHGSRDHGPRPRATTPSGHACRPGSQAEQAGPRPRRGYHAGTGNGKAQRSSRPGALPEPRTRRAGPRPKRFARRQISTTTYIYVFS